MTGEHLGQGTLARAVRPHDSVHLPRPHREGDALENFLAPGRRPQILDLQHDPNLLGVIRSLSDASLEADPQQLLRLDRELHRQLLEDLLAEPVHEHKERALAVWAPLLSIEK